MKPFNNRAFTLVEVLIAVAITSIIGLGTMTMLSESYKHDRVLNIKQLARDFHDDAKFMIGSSKNCAIVSAGNIDVSGNFAIPFTKDADEGIPADFRIAVELSRSSYFSISEGMSFNQGKIIIDSVEIGPYINRGTTTGTMAYFPVSTEVPIADNNSFIGELDVKYHSTREGSVTPMVMVNPFTAILTVDQAHENIVGCRIMDNISDSAAMCASIDGAHWDTAGMKCIMPPDDGSGANTGNLLTTHDQGTVSQNYGTTQ